MLNKIHFSSKSDNWATPQSFYDELNKEFNFTLDPCATKENAKCAKFYTMEDDGLSKSWDNEIVFCNPPYGRSIKHWVKKASESVGGGSCDAHTSKNRYNLLPRLYLQQSRDTIYSWSVKVWRFQKLSTFSEYGCSI